MKPVDKQLDRLLKAASAAPRPVSGAAFVLEARVIAAWRALKPDNDGEFLVAWFRRATIGACMLAVASLAWTFHQQSDRGGVMAVADSAMSMGVEP